MPACGHGNPAGPVGGDRNDGLLVLGRERDRSKESEAHQSVGSETSRLGGRGGIRTHGGLAPTAVFKTAALNRSATLPGARESGPWTGNGPSWTPLRRPAGVSRAARNRASTGGTLCPWPRSAGTPG